jgi:photosystem II stability/assembly factor-like uncharacterized protein
MNKFTNSKLLLILTFCLFVVPDSFSQWEKTNGIKGSYFNQVAGDENNLLAVTNYGTVFHYTNGEWKYRSAFNYINDIYKLHNSWIGYSSNTIMRSDDDGLTWKEILHPDESNFLVAAKVIDDKIYALASDTLYYSSDAGETWNKNEISINVVAGADTGVFYAVSTFYVRDSIMIAGGFTTLPSNFGTVVYSTDLGQHWQATNFPNNNFSNFVFEITGDENYYYVSGSNGFLKSENGIDWQEINEGLPFEGSSVSIGEIDIYRGELIAIIHNTPPGLYRYNGNIWNLFFDNVFPAYISTENDDLIFTSEGEVIKYNENGNIVLTKDLIASTSRPVVSSNGNVYSVYKSKLYRSVDKGLNWNVVRDPAAGTLVVNGDNLYTTSTSGIVRSTNSGNDWTYHSSGIPGSHIPKLSSVGFANSKLYAGFNGVRARMHLPAVWEQGGVYISNNNGETWSAFNSGLPTEGGVHSPVYTITAEGNIVIIYTASGRFSLINNSWVNIGNGFPADTYISTIFIYNDDVIFITNTGLYISHDKGVTKEEFNSGLTGLTNYLTTLFSYDDGLYVFASDDMNTVYKYEGEHWNEVDFPLPENLVFTSLQSVEKNIYAGTYDNGIWRYDPAPTGNGDITNPVEYKLSQNFPNPFNPGTLINYQLAENGQVQIKVYDVLGKEVVTLVNENKQAGKYQIRFDASSLPSGVYFYRIITDRFSETKKMMLLR